MTDYSDLLRRARLNARAHEGPVGEFIAEMADALEAQIAENKKPGDPNRLWRGQDGHNEGE